MKSWGRLVVAGLLAAGLPAAFLLVAVMACGPDYGPEVFVPANQPEKPALFAQGRLGVLQSGYFHAELVVAYRYLSGGKLSNAEKDAYSPPELSPDELAAYRAQREARVAAQPINRWLKAREDAHASPPAAEVQIAQDRVIETKRDDWVERDDQLNCPDAAYATAADTLQNRLKTWGAGSTELMEWVRGQDAVFSNCAKPGTMPAAVQPGWSTALRQDRAYQIAAAKFYALDFDGAIADFVVIGRDKASPWSRWGEYLAARAEVRKAANTGKTADYGELANFDMDGLKSAQARLLKLQQETKDTEVRHAAAAELGFIEVRLEPAKRLDQVSNALAGPQPDREFKQDLKDLDFLMDHNVKGDTDLVRWIRNIQGAGTPVIVKSAAGETTIEEGLSVWRQEHRLPWLVAAIAKAPKGDAELELMDAAAGVKPDSPAYATVNYYRIGLMIGAGKKTEARALADTVIAGLGPNDMDSTRNAFLAERIQTARSLAEFLADAPRTMIESESSSAEMAQCKGVRFGVNQCTRKIPPQQFDADAAESLNTQMPLAVWEEAAQSSVLPKNLREAVAWAAWMRALGLGDAAAAKRMSALLPDAVRKTSSDSDGFPATLALLRNPGLRPYLEQGVQRSVTYGAMDIFRDNWWCGRWGDGVWQSEESAANGQKAAASWRADFLTSQQKKDAADEDARLNALPVAAVWLGQRAIAYVKAHPDDKDAAEALGLVSRATHYSCSGGSDAKDQRAVSKQAFEMLHRMYPKSPWALRTKYYY
jgi:hypothetical protein